MAKQTMARPSALRAARPPRPASTVPAFGGWDREVAAGDKAAAVPDYSLDFTEIRAARKHRRTKALSWSSFVGNAAAGAVAVETTTPGGGGGGGAGSACGEEEEELEKRRCSSAATSDADDDDDDQRRRRHHHLRRLRSADDDDRQSIQPGRPAPKGRRKFIKGYLFGCVGGQW